MAYSNAVFPNCSHESQPTWKPQEMFTAHVRLHNFM